MPRARNLKPGFFKNELLAQCDPWARLLFAGLWTLADRAGRLEDRPLKIKMELFAADSYDVSQGIDELAERGFLARYAVGEHRYIQIVNFCKHQTPHVKEPASTIPTPDEHRTSPMQTPDEHLRIPDTGYLIPDTGLLTPDSGGSGGAAAPGAVAPTADPPFDESFDAESDDSPSPPKGKDGRIYALVDAFARATKRRPDQLQGRPRREAADALRPLVEDATPEDVVGCVVYLRSDAFWRESGRLTVRKVAEVLPQWIADGRPPAIRGSPNGRQVGGLSVEEMVAMSRGERPLRTPKGDPR